MENNEKGNNSAMTNPMDKKKYGSSYFPYSSYIPNFKIVSLTVLDRVQV